ncbi:MAG: hypothetical protein ABIK96_06990 [bacterium]
MKLPRSLIQALWPIAAWGILGMVGCAEDPGHPEAGEAALDIRCLPRGLGAPWTLEQPGGRVSVGYGDTTLAGLTPGDHVLVWSRVPSWISPDPDTLAVRLASGSRDSLVGRYRQPQAGTAVLNIQPQPPELQAPWFLDRGDGWTREGSGEARIEGLATGTYSLFWGHVAGYYLPPGGFRQFELAPGASVTAAGIYRQESLPSGTLIIDAEPDHLFASWELGGPDNQVYRGQGDATFYGMAAGTYFLEWGDGGEWGRPRVGSPTGLLIANQVLRFGGDYLSPDVPEVPGVQVGNGPMAGEVAVSWDSVDNSLDPVARYDVAASPDGPITSGTFASALLLGSFPYAGLHTHYEQVFAPDDGLEIGRRYWFAVQARDETDRASPVTESPDHLVSRGWHLSGVVRDHRGEPVAGVPLDVAYMGGEGPTLRAWSQEDGTFLSPLLLAFNPVGVVTDAAESHPGLYYDVRVEGLDWDGQDSLDITLIPRHLLDDACSEFDHDFLTYLRGMTNTTNPTNNRPDTRLWKWERFPLKVFIPAATGTTGLDLADLCREMPPVWSLHLEQDVFAMTDQPDSAQVVFRFDDDLPQLNGQVSLLLPQGGHFIGDVVPARMEVYINSTMGIARRVQEVALHELGHVLGIADHSQCSDAGYLMYISSSGALDRGIEAAIHPDEKVLAWTIINLPQGVDMANYLAR